MNDNVVMTATMEFPAAMNEIAARVWTAHEACEQHQKDAVLKGIEAGEELIAAKIELRKSGYGQWMRWLETDMIRPGLSYSTAKYYMQMARWAEDPANRQRVGDLSMKEVIELMVESHTKNEDPELSARATAEQEEKTIEAGRTRQRTAAEIDLADLIVKKVNSHFNIWRRFDREHLGLPDEVKPKLWKGLRFLAKVLDRNGDTRAAELISQAAGEEQAAEGAAGGGDTAA